MTQKAFLFLFFYFFCLAPMAQQSSVVVKKAGTPYIKNYTAKDYNADVFSHAIVQDNRGVMYVGNNSGVLEYDGNNWRLIRLSNNSRVYSLAFDKTKNRVYVGGVGDFGYLKPNAQGETVYVSLLPEVPEEEQKFKHVWGVIVVSSSKIFFRTQVKIFILDRDNIQIIKYKKKHSFHKLFHINNVIYVRARGKGLLKFVDNQLQFIPGSNIFVKHGVYTMLPFDAKKILIVTRGLGLLLYDGKTFSSWKTEISDYTKTYRVYGSTQLGDKYFIVNTLRKGIIILDKKGKVVQHINQIKGLISSSIYNSFIDKDANIWATTNKGLSHITLNHPTVHGIT